jgi:transposase
MAGGSVWDEILDTRHVSVLRTYIERWPRKGKPPEKVLIVVVEPDDATLGKGMWAIRKKPGNLTTGQRTALATISRDNKQIYKGYLIKEQLREALHVKGNHGKALLAGVIFWAARARIPEFAKLAKTLRRFLPLIWNTLDHGPSNGRAEALNAQLSALITRARGFRSAAALIAMADFVYGGLCPDSPY